MDLMPFALDFDIKKKYVHGRDCKAALLAQLKYTYSECQKKLYTIEKILIITKVIPYHLRSVPEKMCILFHV